MEVIDRWVAEFFILRQHNPRVSPTNLLSLLKFKDSPDCLKLKTLSILRDISDSLIRGTIDERTLDLLEILEKLSLLTESHKSAYCWTAAECTVKFMFPLSVSDGLFSDAVERIWRKRIGSLKESGSGLVSDELLKWEDDVKVAIEDCEVYQRIRESNVRYKAVSFLTQLLKEQWGVLGSSTLESVAQRRFRKRKAEYNLESTERLESEANEHRDVEGAEEERRQGQEHETSLDKGDKRRFRKRRAEYNLESSGPLESEANEQRGSGNNDKVNEQHGAEEEERRQEQEHETSLDEGDKTVARELKECLLEIQRQIDASTSHVQEEPVAVTPRRTRFNRTGTTSGQDHNVTQDNVSGSEGTYSGRVRPHLPTPEPWNLSPLRKAGPTVRRRKKFWTPEEEAALREGVKEYGKSWKDIKNANPVVFAERTEVDLKDKWRNLTR